MHQHKDNEVGLGSFGDPGDSSKRVLVRSTLLTPTEVLQAYAAHAAQEMKEIQGKLASHISSLDVARGVARVILRQGGYLGRDPYASLLQVSWYEW